MITTHPEVCRNRWGRGQAYRSVGSYRGHGHIGGHIEDGEGELAKLGQVFNEMRGRIMSDRQALLDSEGRFRTLVENIPGAVYRCVMNVHWTVTLI